MKDTQSITIGLLLITAAILTVLVIGTFNDRPAHAGHGGVRQGNYIMAAGKLSTTREVLYLINIPAMRMITYVLHPSKPEITAITGVDLKTTLGGP